MKFGELKCVDCGILGSIRPMHRANEKGVPAIWKCESCLKKPIDPEILAITDFVETDNMEKDVS